MNWNNIDLNSSEVESNILNAYSFKTLLLEVECNVREINEETIRQQFTESLNAHIFCAREIFNANLQNILNQALADRAID